MNTTTTCPARFWLEAHSAGEPAPADQLAHFASCLSCQAALSLLRRGQEAFLSRQPPARFRAAVLQRRSAARGRWWWGLAVPLAAGLTMLVAQPWRAPSVTLKGPAFHVLIKRAGASEVEVATPHARAAKGDALRFAYRAIAPGYLLILDVDASGRLESFFPYGHADAVPVRPTDDPLLPGSIALDGTPGAEHVFAVFRPQPFSFAFVAQQLVFAADGEPPRLVCDGCEVTTLTLYKEP
jgi:Domain of unknown function (DUF4384)